MHLGEHTWPRVAADTAHYNGRRRIGRWSYVPPRPDAPSLSRSARDPAAADLGGLFDLEAAKPLLTTMALGAARTG